VVARPVPLNKVERQLAQRVDLRVVPDDQDVIEGEAVPETRGAGGERKQDERADQYRPADPLSQ
jgi:hypothetical protein